MRHFTTACLLLLLLLQRIPVNLICFLNVEMNCITYFYHCMKYYKHIKSHATLHRMKDIVKRALRHLFLIHIHLTPDRKRHSDSVNILLCAFIPPVTWAVSFLQHCPCFCLIIHVRGADGQAFTWEGDRSWQLLYTLEDTDPYLCWKNSPQLESLFMRLSVTLWIKLLKRARKRYSIVKIIY